ncbi:hypothetical protein BKA70DRAFT_1297126 [Coprinopsis sp. MPI-PUGE-AT-0042]|nr:hypothetical protein BKA70DRAFT_1297126 [Coprinopsis sp. MPI-PUGE-AT-0042]
MPQSQHIVIIGGGAAGAAVAKDLAAKLSPSTHSLTLVTPRPFFVNLPALVRASVTAEGGLEDLVLMPYADFMVAPKPHPSGTEKFKGTIKIGKAASFTSEEGGNGGGEVVLEGGERLPYSILVLATGNTWNGPLNLPDGDFSNSKAYLDEWRERFKVAKDVVLIGGGSVGIEYAGEILDFYPGTKVTVVHSQDKLFNGAYPDKFRCWALTRIQKAGVDVVLDDLLEDVEISAGSVTTKKGKVIKADLVIPTWGGKPNTSIVSSSLGAEVLSKTGHVLVQPTLQVKGHPRILAVGDIIEWDEQKASAKTGAHSRAVATNILNLTSGKSGAVPLKEYKGSLEIMVVTFGRSGGISYFAVLWGIVLGDWCTQMIKSKGLLVEMVRRKYKFGNYRTASAKA